MAAVAAPAGHDFTDTVIVGNGPSALILSYILHGNVPVYVGGHPDKVLDRHLSRNPDLLRVDAATFDYFASSTRYSSQALPLNALLDSLIRPGGDVNNDLASCVAWRHDAARAVPHVLLSDAPRPGGQWTENVVSSVCDTGTLSYADQLSLPGYSFADHWRAVKGAPLPDLIRPDRALVADYYAKYPSAAGIASALRPTQKVQGISRTPTGFHVSSHNLRSTHLVLASGTFNIHLPPPPLLAPLSTLASAAGAVLIVGSGFTAADAMLATPPDRKIIHLFNWEPDRRPSPLRACHAQAYPEYAFIYRQMKKAAAQFAGLPTDSAPQKAKLKPQTSTIPSFALRNWAHTYEGFPNARVTAIHSPTAAPPTMTVQIGRSAYTHSQPRVVGSFAYAAGRRSSLAYLDPPLLHAVLPSRSQYSTTARSATPLHTDFALADKASRDSLISGSTLRARIEAEPRIAESLTLAPGVFCVGSLTGDSLVRFAFGGCCAVAGRIHGLPGMRDDGDEEGKGEMGGELEGEGEGEERGGDVMGPLRAPGLSRGESQESKVARSLREERSRERLFANNEPGVSGVVFAHPEVVRHPEGGGDERGRAGTEEGERRCVVC